jgi:hypothetical protein
MASRSTFIRQFGDGYFSRLKLNRSDDHTDYIVSALKVAKSAEDRWFVRHTLIGELTRLNRFEEAAKLHLEDIRDEPNNPLPLISLASHYQYSDVKLELAKSYIRRAVALAKRSRMLCYNALGQQARVAIATKDWVLLTKTLKDLTTYRHKTGNADCFPENDFLASIPRGAISDKVVASYIKRRRYLSMIGYSTLYGKEGRSPSNRSVQPTRKKSRAAD